MEEVKILPSIRRLIFSKLAQFCTETKGSDLCQFMKAFEILRSKVGDEPLREHYKESYPRLRRTLLHLNMRLNKLKTYYDSIPKLEDKMKEQRINELFKEEYNRLPLINRTMFKSFELLLENTQLRFMSIPKECFKGVEKEKKSIIDTDKKEKKDESSGKPDSKP